MERSSRAELISAAQDTIQTASQTVVATRFEEQFPADLLVHGQRLDRFQIANLGRQLKSCAGKMAPLVAEDPGLATVLSRKAWDALLPSEQQQHARAGERAAHTRQTLGIERLRVTNITHVPALVVSRYLPRRVPPMHDHAL